MGASGFQWGCLLQTTVGIHTRVLKGNWTAGAFSSDSLGLVTTDSKVVDFRLSRFWCDKVGGDFSASVVNFEDKLLHNAYS